MEKEHKKAFSYEKLFKSPLAEFKKKYPVDTPKRFGKEVATGAGSMLIAIPTTCLTMQLGAKISPTNQLFMLPNPKNTQTVPWARRLPSDWATKQLITKNLVSTKNVHSFHAPILEEVLFRGLLMPGMEKGFKTAGAPDNLAKTGAIIGNSLLYAAAHPKGARAACLVNGLIWSTLTYQANGSLAPATAGHIVNNIAALKIRKL